MKKRPVICHRHCRRGIIRTRRGSCKEGWFRKKSSDGEGVFTWSVLLLVAVIDPYTFNSDDAYPLNPRQKGACRSGLPKSLSPHPLLRSRYCAQLDPGTPSWEERTETGKEHSFSEASWLENDLWHVRSYGQWVSLIKFLHLLTDYIPD